MKSFFGLSNVYRRFVLGFTKITASLIRGLKNGEPLHFEPNKTEWEVVDELKKKSISLPTPALLKSTGKFTVDPDASDGQLGCVWLQE